MREYIRFDENISKLIIEPKLLKDNEQVVLFVLSSFLNDYNISVDDKNMDMTAKWISKHIDMSENEASNALTGLYNKGIIYNVTKIIDNKKYICYMVNEKFYRKEVE